MLNTVTTALMLLAASTGARAFVTPSSRPTIMTHHRSKNYVQPLSNDASGGASGGQMEEIEFRIYPDGRVTEIVRGVKGKSCEQITEAINKQLGKVVASQPTEEMFEQEVVIDQTIQDRAGIGGEWDGASSW